MMHLIFLFFMTLGVHGALDISLRLSTYEAEASNVIMYVDFTLTSDIPSDGLLIIETPGTIPSPEPDQSGAFIVCEDFDGVHMPIQECSAVHLVPPPGGALSPFRIRFPHGVVKGSRYSLAIGGLLNQWKVGIIGETYCYTATADQEPIEAQALGPRFRYAKFHASLKLSSYQTSAPTSVAVRFTVGPAVSQDGISLILDVMAVSGQGTLNCTYLWDPFCNPVPGCEANSMVGRGSQYRINITRLLPNVKYSFAISGLTNTEQSGPTPPNTMTLMQSNTVLAQDRGRPFVLHHKEEEDISMEEVVTDMQMEYVVESDGKIAALYGGGSDLWVGYANPSVPLEFGMRYFKQQAAIIFGTGPHDRILILGLGIGGIPAIIHAIWPQAFIDAVDIDPAVIQKTLQLPHMALGDRFRVFEDDAAKFIQKSECTNSYDLILFDVYDGFGIPKPFHRAAFYQAVVHCLKETGVFSINLINDLPEMPLIEQHLQGVLVMPKVIKRSDRTNHAIFGWASPQGAQSFSMSVMENNVKDVDTLQILPYLLLGELDTVADF